MFYFTRGSRNIHFSPSSKYQNAILTSPMSNLSSCFFTKSKLTNDCRNSFQNTQKCAFALIDLREIQLKCIIVTINHDKNGVDTIFEMSFISMLVKVVSFLENAFISQNISL